MGQEEHLLTSTEIDSSLKYDIKGEISTSSILAFYIFTSLILLPLLLSTNLPPFYTNMSQHDLIHYEQIIQQ